MSQNFPASIDLSLSESPTTVEAVAKQLHNLRKSKPRIKRNQIRLFCHSVSMNLLVVPSMTCRFSL